MRLRGILMLVMRRIRGFKQDEIAVGLGVPSQREVSALEHGVGASPEVLNRCASFLRFEPVDQVVGLEALHFLEGSALRSRAWHPIELTPAEQLAAMRRSWEVARLVQDRSTNELRQRKLAQARALAAEQWARLEKCPHPLRVSFVDMAPEFRTWGLGELLITKSRQAAARDAGIARELAELAVAVAYPVGSCRLLSHAYGMLGNALRVAGRLDPADALLDRAERLWRADDDDGGLLDPGRIGSLIASLRRAQRRFPEAHESLDKVLPVSHEPGRVLFQKANIYQNAGEHLAALETLDRAEELLLTGEHELRDLALIHHERGTCLCHLDRHAEALPYARSVTAIATRTENHLDELRALWLQARVSAGLGDLAEALRRFEVLRVEFQELQLDYDLALVSLEIAALLLELRRVAEAQALGLDLLRVFATWRIHREAMAALRLACEALRTRSATAELIRAALAGLYRGRGLR